ncbi:MAG TPA: lysophospholipid acyltransferase family protein [Flavitalea sp.]|nr:lysophospholipid acyltransferase family protein [Flavitalea sp.]
MIVLRALYVLYALMVFLLFMLIILPAAFVATFFGRIKGGNLIYRFCCLWADAWFFLTGIRHRNYFEHPHDRNRQYIFVANHISYLDAPLVAKTIRQPVRALGKIETSKVPLFGFIYQNAIVTVNRRSAENRAQSVRILKSVLKKGISIFIFPEGTLNETGKPLKNFYDGAFRIAIESQTPIKPILFLDTYDRLSYKSFLSLTPGRSRSIFLEEIPVHGYTLNDLDYLKTRVYDLLEQKLLEYNASWIEIPPMEGRSSNTLLPRGFNN